MNNVLIALLIWLPATGPLPPTVEATFIRKTFQTEAECQAAREDLQLTWSRRDEQRMVGTRDCTDGALPTNISIGSIVVSVVNADGGGG